MSELSEIRCATKECAESIEKYGANYHSVYDGAKKNKKPEDGVAYCERCGGIFDGEKWHHNCSSCGASVKAGELVGLFVPHNCLDCQNRLRESEIASRKVCRRCNKPYCDCCC